jgi:hypothetical protein
LSFSSRGAIRNRTRGRIRRRGAQSHTFRLDRSDKPTATGNVQPLGAFGGNGN